MLRYKLAPHADVHKLVTRVPKIIVAFTRFLRVLPTSRVVYWALNSIERVVYCLNKDYFRLLE